MLGFTSSPIKSDAEGTGPIDASPNPSSLRSSGQAPETQSQEGGNPSPINGER